MKVLHLNAGNETGGGMYHILSLLNELDREQFVLGVFEKGKLLEKAQTLGIKTVVFKQRNRFDCFVIKQLIEFIRHNNIEIVHTHGPRANFIAYLMGKWIRFHWVITLHSDPRDDFLGKGLKGKLYQSLNIKVMRKADHLLAISNRFKEILIELNYDQSKITSILNGIDFKLNINNPYSRTDFQLSETDFVIMMVARLERVKGHQIVFQALSEIIKNHNHRNVHLLLIGDGSLKKNLQRKVHKQQLDQHVHFLGYREDVDRIYSIANIVLLASFSESFPLVLLEAARAGVPIISSDVGGVQRLVPSKEFGWITEVGSSKDIVKAVNEAIEYKKNGILEKVGFQLREYASRMFSVESFAEKVYNTYLKMIKY